MTTINQVLQAGLEAHRAGRLDEAESLYRQALEANPRHAQSHHMMGLMAFHRGNLEAAVQYLQNTIKLDAFTAMYPADLGEIYRAMGKLPEAIAAYRQAIKLNPESAESQTNLGTLLQASGDLEGAVASFVEAVDVDPKYAAAHRNLGNVLLSGGKLAEAQAAFVTAAELNPQDPQSFFDLGYAFHADGRLDNAIACYQRTIELRPDAGDAHYHLGMAQLARGNHQGAWNEYEWRLQPQLTERSYAPMWNGENLNGQPILVHAKCSLADTIQFLRFVPLVAQRGGQITLEVDPALVPLMKQSGFNQVIPLGSPPPHCVAQISVLSLPRLSMTTLETIPTRIPYLAASETLVQQWQAKLRGLTGLTVGIVWQGDPAANVDRTRSIPLTEFLPLSGLPGVRLISLQKRHGLDQLAALTGQAPVVDLGPDFDEANGPLMDTAAVMKNLDLVITCDTAAAHLAGALGVKVWVALPQVADWRWMLDRQDSPWYPTMRVFRQLERGNWTEVFNRIAVELTRLTGGHG